jgi:uncharacterized surface protein with fasciclin (FAS1) repeats
MSDPNAPGFVPPPLPDPVLPEAQPGIPSGEGVPPLPDATAQMPVTDAAGGTPPGTPPGTGLDGPAEDEPGAPWYKKPGPLFALLLALLAVGGIIAWAVLGGGDDEPVASPGSSMLVFSVTDETGQPLDTGFIVGVTGPAGSEADYTWLRPEGAVPGDVAGNSAGSDGRVEFEWKPAGANSDAATWAATVTVVQQEPAGWAPPGPIVDCVLARPDTQDSVIAMAVDADVPDPAADQIVNYTFPNYQFLAGDTVTCRVASVRPVPTTSTTTTVADTTTTVADTTTTTAADTTTTVAPTTTVPIITVPPQPEATLWDVIDNSPDLSGLEALIKLAGLQDVFSNPDATLTLLAPTNQAITAAAGGVGAPDFANPAIVEAVLLTHVDTTRALTFAQLVALDPPEFVAANPGPHAIDAAANPATIGGAAVILIDIEASNGVLHVIDKVLLPKELP